MNYLTNNFLNRILKKIKQFLLKLAQNACVHGTNYQTKKHLLLQGRVLITHTHTHTHRKNEDTHL